MSGRAAPGGGPQTLGVPPRGDRRHLLLAAPMR